MAEENRLVLDYTNRDFESIRSLLLRVAAGKLPEWTTAGEATDFGTLLLELYAYMGDVMNYYIDRVGAEAFLGTAQRTQSVYYMADMLGYRPLGVRAATTVVEFSLPSSAPAEVLTTLYDGSTGVVVPAGTKVTTSGEQAVVLTFETTSDAAVPVGGSASVTAHEGSTKTLSLGTSASRPNLVYDLPDKNVIFQSMVVTTSEGGRSVPWTEVDSVANARPNQSAYSTYIDDNGYTHILFGDGSSGRVPQGEISVTYRHGSGAAGNEVPQGSLTSIVSTDNWASYVTATNTATSKGGGDPEKIDTMRFAVPRAARIRNRAVTLDDHVALAIQVPGIAKAIAYGSVYSSVTIRVAPVDGFSVSDQYGGETPKMLEYRASVAEYLKDKVLMGGKVFVERVQWHDVDVSLDVVAMEGYEREAVRSDVEAAVAAVFDFDRLDFGSKVTKGDVYRAVVAVPGVDYADLTLLKPVTASIDESSTADVQNILPPSRKVAQIRRSRDEANFGEQVGLTVNVTGGLGA